MKIENHFDENGKKLEEILEQFLLIICNEKITKNL